MPAMNTKPFTHLVYDTRTKTIVRQYRSREAARRAADRLDLEYGAIRYQVRAIG